MQQDVVFVTIDTLKLAIGFKKATIKHGFEIQGPTLVELEKELESENKPGPYHFKLSKEEYDALLSNSKRITYYQAIMDVYTSVMKSGDLIFKVLGEYLNLQINLVPDFLFKSCTSYLRALSNQSWEALTDFISDFDTKLKARIMTKQHYLVQKSNSIHQQIHILRSLHFNISNANMPETTKLVIKLLEKAEAMVKEIDQRMAEAPDNIPACEHYFEHMNKTQAINHSEVTGAAKLLCEKIEKIEDYFKENAAIVSSLQKQYQEKATCWQPK
ncbi:MAG: hypothetical protein HWD59_14430 [Coxiellaceae bacterium]|nr:MAG: hypothetical protein HWD59_14430 [Coxiellaceae bacterium]